MADPSSPAAVASATFSQARKGADVNEVRDFLQKVSFALTRAQSGEADTRALLTAALSELEMLKARPPAPAELDEATVSNLLGQEAARVLTTAREGAASLRARVEGEVETARLEAERDIAKQRSDAAADIASQRAAADEEAALIRRNAAEGAEREMESAKSQGRDMVLEARAYRERVMTDLARRREAARQQIEVLRLQRARLRSSFSNAEAALSEIRHELADDIPDPDPLEEQTGISGAFPVVAAVTAVRATSPSSTFVIGEIVPPLAPVAPHMEPESPDAEVEAEPVEVDKVEVDAAEADAVEVEPVEVDVAEVEVMPIEVRSDDAEVAQTEPEAQAEPEPEPEPEPEAQVHVESLVEPSEVVDARPVDDLFARIRAGRIAEVANLQEAPQAAPIVEATVSMSSSATESSVASEVLQIREASLAPLEASVSRRLKRVLADEQSNALDQLRRRKVAPAADELLGSSGDYTLRYQEAVRDDLQQAARIGATSIAGLSAHDLADIVSAEDVIGHALGEVEREMIQPLRLHLERSLASAGDDADEAASQLRSVYREWKVQRIEALVGNLVLTAHGRGAFAALVPGTPVCWIVDEANRPCAEGDDNALAGTVAVGEEFPTGHRSVPAYPGCRCAITPVSR